MSEFETRDERDVRINSLNQEIDNLEHEISGLTRAFYVFIGLILLVVVLLFVNGMLVHYETGLDELDNRVFIDGEVQEI